MQARWNHDNPGLWDAAHARVRAPLQQDWAYGSTMKMLGVGVERVVVEQDGEPVALAQFLIRCWGSLAAVALCSRGPVWLKDLSATDKKLAYRTIKQSLPLGGLKWMLVSPEDDGAGLSALRRVMTGYATVMVDLTASEEQLRADLEVNWRNQLKAAETQRLVVDKMSDKAGAYRWLIEAELKQRQDRGLAGLPPEFFDVYMQARKNPALTVLGLRADVGKSAVAGMVFVIHGKAATYQIGWSNEAGREARANNLLLWRAMLELKGWGIEQLDLGGVNTQRSAGLARFKMGTGGQVLRLPGTYLL